MLRVSCVFNSFSCLPPLHPPPFRSSSSPPLLLLLLLLILPALVFLPSFFFLYVHSRKSTCSVCAPLYHLPILSLTFSDDACKQVVTVINFAQLQCSTLIATPDTKRGTVKAEKYGHLISTYQKRLTRPAHNIRTGDENPASPTGSAHTSPATTTHLPPPPHPPWSWNRSTLKSIL